MEQAREYGQYLRKRYRNFLSSQYNRSYVLARSTDYDRTLQSSYTLLSGLYPPKQTSQKFDQTLNWQPIPVHTTSKASDMVCLFKVKRPFLKLLTILSFKLFHTAGCPLYDKLQNEQYSSQAYFDAQAANKVFFYLHRFKY